ncbi:MAG: DeoR/GlpR family DNA-binding transcription regulator [Clostridia bacterium]|nr:DeoR/GlpR family DNA-binding transcription regulator [Clostridia bacterium]
MLAIDRYHAIKEILSKQESASVAELGRAFGVSDETIRRDLDKLSQTEKSVVRVHGGAYMVKTFDKEAPFAVRRSLLIEQKERIAAQAFSLVEDGDMLMLDSSTTTLHLAHMLRDAEDKKLMVITNALGVVEELSDCAHIKLLCVGGVLRQTSHSFVGYTATDTLQEYRANKAFVSCSGIHERFGVTDNSEEEAQVRRAMLQNSETRYLLIDSEKFGRYRANRIVELAEVDEVITDAPLQKGWQGVFTKAAVNLVVCPADGNGAIILRGAL